jgi:hypothetical protein
LGHERGQEGLFFYKKYERFISEWASSEQNLELTKEARASAKFQKLGALHPHA